MFRLFKRFGKNQVPEIREIPWKRVTLWHSPHADEASGCSLAVLQANHLFRLMLTHLIYSIIVMVKM